MTIRNEYFSLDYLP